MSSGGTPNTNVKSSLSNSFSEDITSLNLCIIFSGKHV